MCFFVYSQEVARLESLLSENLNTETSVRNRESAEQLVSLELREENLKLSQELRSWEERRSGYEGQISDLTANVQRYVNEVKRTEELLAHRDKERSELLEQYRHLSVEVDSAETYGRKMEGQVESLNVQLSTRSSELSASHLRLSTIETDLVEMTLANERLRSEVVALSAKVDHLEAQLKEAQSQTSWMDSDLSNIHELAVQLNSQKVELQTQISEQAGEIETLNGEIANLRSEVEGLSGEVEQERQKSQDLARQLGGESQSRPTRN